MISGATCTSHKLTATLDLHCLKFSKIYLLKTRQTYISAWKKRKQKFCMQKVQNNVNESITATFAMLL